MPLDGITPGNRDNDEGEAQEEGEGGGPMPFGPPGRAGSGAQHHSFCFSVRRTSSALTAPKGVSPYKTADNRRRDGISQIRRKWVSQWPYIAAIVTSEHITAIGWRVTPVSGLQRPYLARWLSEVSPSTSEKDMLSEGPALNTPVAARAFLPRPF